MPNEKTKKLLDNLKNITAKKDRFASEPSPSSTNRYWPGTSFGSLPQSYDKAKRHKDDDGDEFIYVDRVYGGLFGYETLEQKDGTTYTGKLHNKRRLIKGVDGQNFYSRCTITADGKWFDNSGWPITPPKEVEVEKKEEEETPTFESWDSEPKEKKEKIELDMLKKLK